MEIIWGIGTITVIGMSAALLIESYIKVLSDQDEEDN
jgi:hypothetical protein